MSPSWNESYIMVNAGKYRIVLFSKCKIPFHEAKLLFHKKCVWYTSTNKITWGLLKILKL